MSRSDLAGSRVQEGDIQTAIHTHVHKSSGRTITVIGTLHVAEPQYFAAMRTTIDQLEADGAVVQHEKLDKESARARVTDAERDVLETEINRNPNGAEAAKNLGFDWVFQADALPWAEHWRRVDVDSLDLLRMLGTAPLPRSRIQRYAAKQKRTSPDSQAPAPSGRSIKIQRWALLAIQRRSAKGRRPVAMTKQQWKIHQTVAIDWRNIAAASAALRTTLNDETDVVMLWGPLHLPGIAEILRRNGFDLIDTQWMTAIHH